MFVISFCEIHLACPAKLCILVLKLWCSSCNLITKMYEDLALIYVVGYSIVSILHLVGLLLLYKANSNLPNQRLLLMNLASAEMLLCWSMLTLFSIQFRAYNMLIVKCIDAFFNTLFFIEIRFTMLHIIFDRYIEIYTNIRYPLYMTNKKILLVLLTHWSISFLCATISFTLDVTDVFERPLQFTFFLCLVIDIVIFISSFSTYMYFFKKVRRIRAMEVNVTDQQRESLINLLIEKFKVPCLIVLTYLIFNLTSTIMLTSAQYVQSRKQAKVLMAFSQVPILVGIISDLIIYVLANGNVRRFICSKVRSYNLQLTRRPNDVTVSTA